MVPVGRIVIVRTVSRDELVTALNYLTVPALLGPLCGPPLGGFITTYWNCQALHPRYTGANGDARKFSTWPSWGGIGHSTNISSV